MGETNTTPNEKSSSRSVQTDDAVASVAKGGGFLFGGSMFEYVARFGIAFLLADITGADGYGRYTLAVSVGAALTGIASLGLDDTMVRYVAILRERNDREGLAGAIYLGLGASFATGVLAALALWLLAPSIAVGIFDDDSLITMLRAVAIAMPSLTLSNALLGCIRGTGRMDHAAFSESTLQTTVRLVTLAALALIGQLDPFAAVIVFGLADLTSSISMAILLNRSVDLRALVQIPRRIDWGELLSFAMPLWFAGVMNSVRRNVSTFLLGSIENVSQVGLLSVVGRINLLARVGYRSVIVGVKPVLARLHDAGDKEGMAVLYTASTRWTLNMSLPFFILVSLHSKAILGLLGAEFEAASNALIVMAFAELIVGGTGICGSIIDMTRHMRTKMINPILLGIVVVTANFVLIPNFGILGAAWAAVVAAAFINVLRIGEVWFLERLFPYDWSYWKSFAAAVVASACGLGLKSLPFSGVLWLGAQAVVIGGTFAAALVALKLSDADKMIVDRARHRLLKMTRGRKETKKQTK